MRTPLLRLMMVLMVLSPVLACNSGGDKGNDSKASASSDKDSEGKASAKKDKGTKKKDKAKKDGAKKDDAKKADKEEKDDTKKDDAKKDDAKAEETPKGPPFKGPASKAIVGKWDIRLSNKILPEGADKMGAEGLAGLTRGTMKFDGSVAVVDILGQAEALPYTVLSEKDNVMEVARKGSDQVAFKITFLTQDHIKLEEAKRKGEMTGTRLP